MDYYLQNVDILKQYHPTVAAGLAETFTEDPTVAYGEAQNHEIFLAYQIGDIIRPLGSIYDPSHAADCFTKQFKDLPASTSLLVFGFGDGRILRRLLQEYHIQTCIVYEPSQAVFCQALQSLNLKDLLSAEGLHLIVGDVNEKDAASILDEQIDYLHWKTFSIVSLPIYSDLFAEELGVCFGWYQNCILSKQASGNANILFAETKFKNEIHTMKWMVDSYAFSRMKGAFPKDLPCIVVAAGPSLEKNVQFLKQAKGHSCIIAVDSAVKYLLDADIRPDFICTADPNKPAKVFEDERLHGLPVFLYTSSNHEVLENLQVFDPIYVSSETELYSDAVHDRGAVLEELEGGGSVATICFSVAVELGFETIILIGQDLAYTEMKSHAGTGDATKEELSRLALFEVEGYEVDRVLTSGDFKVYIDWYNQVIPTLNDTHTIINATEGGAKLQGATQMPLSIAVDTYCKTDCNCETVYKTAGKLWESAEDRENYLHTMEQKERELHRIITYAQTAAECARRASTLLERPAYDAREIQSLQKKMNTNIDRINATGLYGILCLRIEENNMAMAEALDQKTNSVEDEQRTLFTSIQSHMEELIGSAEEALKLWPTVLAELQERI